MRQKISIAIVLILIVLALVAVVSKTNTTVELQQLDLKTKEQEIEIIEQQLETNQTELEKAKDDQKKLKEVEEKNKQLQKDLEDAQARKLEKQRIAQAEAQNAVQAAPETPTAQVPVGNVEQIVRDAAIKHGLNPDWFVQLAMCESTMNPNAVNYGYNENGNPSGLFQHLSGYWPGRAAAHGYAGASVFDPVANANVTAAMWSSGSHLWECQ